MRDTTLTVTKDGRETASYVHDPRLGVSPSALGVNGWTDDTTPRTDKPVFFRYRDCGGFPFGFDSIVRRGFRSKMTRA